MNELQTTFKMRDHSGNAVEVPFHAKEYSDAGDMGLSLTQYLTQKYGNGTDEVKYGSVIGQFMASAGMFLGEDYTTGIKPPSMKAVISDGVQLSAITRNDGTKNTTPSGRLLFPEIIMRTIESELRSSSDDFLAGWEKMIAQTATINGPKFEQPIINVKAPEAQASNPIAQLAEPDALVSITVSEVSRSIPTKSIGLIISDQAQAATTLDLVSLVLSAQARGERVRNVEQHIAAIVSGDADRGMSALTPVTSKSFDGALTVDNTISHKAWVKYLRANYRKMSLNRLACNLDTAMIIEKRSDKPVSSTAFNPNGTGFGVDLTIENLAVNSPPLLIVADGVLATGTVLGLDSRYAIRRVVNAQAAYSAIENYLMRRATAFRIDYGEFAHRLYDDAFSVLSLDNTP